MSLVDQLAPDQRELVQRLVGENSDYIQRQAMLKVLLEPGFEEAFLARYFGHRLDAKLEDFHIRLIKTALYEPRGLVLFPAQHGKTTIISTMLPILAAIRNPDIRIAELLKNDDEAAAVMSSIKAELEQNELLIADFGPFRPDNGDPMRTWGAGAISFRQRNRLGKEHTITVFGAGSRQILGWRTDWVICDDVVTEKNSATEEQRQKHVTWYNDCVETSPQKRAGIAVAGRITTVGTMFHPRDLYATIGEKVDRTGTPRYKSHREDAIRDWEKQETLWPAVWSWDDMMDIKAAEGTLSFNKRYRNKPVDESEQPFREDWLRGGGELPKGGRHPGCLNRDRVLGDVGEAVDSGWRMYQMFDPAVGKGKNAKRCGHIVFGIDPEDPRRYHITELHFDQMTVPQQRDLLIETHLRYPNMVLTVTEENAYQAGLNQVVEEECQRRGIHLRFEGHTTGRNKQDPTIGIPSLSPVVENGNLDIPYGNPESIRMAEILLEQLVEYPFYAYTDLLMALWFGHLKAQNAVAHYKSMNRLNPKSMYYRMQQRSNRIKRNPWYENQSNQAPLAETAAGGPDDVVRS